MSHTELFLLKYCYKNKTLVVLVQKGGNPMIGQNQQPGMSWRLL